MQRNKLNNQVSVLKGSFFKNVALQKSKDICNTFCMHINQIIQLNHSEPLPAEYVKDYLE